MKLEQKNIDQSTVNLYIPFDQLGTVTVDLNKKFSRKLLEGRRRTIEITRDDFRSAPDPMLTDFISDKAMEELCVDVAMRLDNRDKGSIRLTDDFNAAFWEDWESVLRHYGVPYVEEATLNDFKVGDRVFVKGVAGSTYGTVVELPEPPKVDEVVDDGDYTTMTVETDDGQRITADIWETVKEY